MDYRGREPIGKCRGTSYDFFRFINRNFLRFLPGRAFYHVEMTNLYIEAWDEQAKKVCS